MVAGQGGYSVAVAGTALSTGGVFVFAQPAPGPPPTWPGLAGAVLVATATAVFPASAAVEGAQFRRPGLFASGEASGTERTLPPPQIRSRPMYPVRQDITWHREV